MRTRAWEDPERLSSTVVQFRDDAEPMVWMHTNLGWVPISNTPKNALDAEKFAANLATGYQLEECSDRRTRWFLGEDHELNRPKENERYDD